MSAADALGDALAEQTGRAERSAGPHDHVRRTTVTAVSAGPPVTVDVVLGGWTGIACLRPYAAVAAIGDEVILLALTDGQYLAIGAL